MTPPARGRHALASVVAWLTASAATLALAHPGGLCPPADAPVDLATAARILEPELSLPSVLGAAPELEALVLLQDQRSTAPAGGGGRGGTPSEAAPSDEDVRTAWNALAERYGVPAPVLDDTLRADVAWLQAAGAQVRAVELAVVADDDPGTVLARASYWSTPLLARLRVGRGGVRPDGCFVRSAGSVRMPLSVAQDLLQASDDAWMLAFAPDGQDAQGWFAWFGRDQFHGAVTFAHADLSDRDSFSAVFYGPGPSLTQVARAVPQVRSSLPPATLLSWVRELASGR